MEITEITEVESSGREITLQKVRDLAVDLLEQETRAQEVSEALVFIAVEMSLHIADNKVRVLPILLQAMVDAARANESALDSSSADESAEASRPLTTTIH